jgi:hypothetical protein
MNPKVQRTPWLHLFVSGDSETSPLGPEKRFIVWVSDRNLFPTCLLLHLRDDPSKCFDPSIPTACRTHRVKGAAGIPPWPFHSSTLFPSSSLGTQLCRSSSFDSHEAVPKPELGNEGKDQSLETSGKFYFPSPCGRGLRGGGRGGIFHPSLCPCPGMGVR